MKGSWLITTKLAFIGEEIGKLLLYALVKVVYMQLMCG